MTRKQSGFAGKNSTEKYETIEGKLMRVSDPVEFDFPDRKGSTDYYFLGIKTVDERRIMVSITTEAMGWFGDVNKSKIWYWNTVKKRQMKTSLSNPEQFLGKKFRITGHLETINANEKKFKMTHVQEVVIFIE